MLKVLEGGKSEKTKQTKKEADEGRARAAVAAVAAGGAVLPMDLDELARDGARMMLKHALRIEADDYVERHAGERAPDGRALVVGNGRAKERHVTTGSGTFEIRAPRVNDKRVIDGERQRFTSRILPPYMRRSPKVDAVLPVLYLRGLSTGDFKIALRDLLGADAAGLSPSAITRLTAAWQGEYDTWQERSLADRDFVYVWVDGVHFGIRLEEDPLAALVVVGVRPDGSKELIAVEDGYRESEAAWASLLRDLKKRGMRAPVLAVGDGALGFWSAKRKVWPETREQRCWFHYPERFVIRTARRLVARGRLASRSTGPPPPAVAPDNDGRQIGLASRAFPPMCGRIRSTGSASPRSGGRVGVRAARSQSTCTGHAGTWRRAPPTARISQTV